MCLYRQEGQSSLRQYSKVDNRAYSSKPRWSYLAAQRVNDRHYYLLQVRPKLEADPTRLALVEGSPGGESRAMEC